MEKYQKYEKKNHNKNKYVRGILFVILLFALYEIAGLILPYIITKQVSQQFKDNFQIQQFYGGEENGVDRATVVEKSQEALDIRLQILDDAKEQIILSSFSIKNDQSCQEIFSVIWQAAQRGVKVKIIGDAVSCGIDMKFDPMYYLLGTHPNVEIRFYNMPNLLEPWNLNGRLHDKYIIVDNRLLLLGGRNTSNYFLGEYNPDVLSFDRDVLVYNSAWKEEENERSVIKQTEEYFQTLWESKDTEPVFDQIPKNKEKKVKAAEEQFQNTYQRLRLERPELFPEQIDYETMTVPTKKITLIYNPINLTQKEPWVWYQLEQLMLQAKKRVYIQSPYVVPNKQMYQSLKEIGSDIEEFDVLLNSIAVGDNFMASSDYKFNRKKLYRTGIRIHEFQGIHSTHNKSLLIDDNLSMVGSYNLDMRSTYIDTESALIIHGEEFNQELESCIRELEAQSLVVKEDGTYEPSDQVKPATISGMKKVLFTITSVVFQLFRYLL